MLKNERYILILLATLNFTHILDFMILMPLGNFLMPYFDLSAQQFSWLVSVYAISGGVSSFVSSFFVDRFDRKKVLLIVYMGFLLATLACGLAWDFYTLLGARVLSGVFGGMISAQVLSIVSDLIPYERRGQAMGMVMTAFSIASTIGVPFSLYLANSFNWQAPFYLVSSLGVLLMPFLWKILPNVSGHLQNSNNVNGFEKVSSMFKNKAIITSLIFSCLMVMGHFIIIPFINPFLEFNMGFSKKLTPLVYLVGGLCSFFAANFLGVISDKYGKLKVYVFCVLMSLPMILFITNMPNISFYLILVVFGLWFMVATGRGVTAQAMISNQVNPELRGSFQSLNSCVQQLGTGFASLTSGLIVIKQSNGSIEYYWVLGVLSIIILVATIFFATFSFKNFETLS